MARSKDTPLVSEATPGGGDNAAGDVPDDLTLNQVAGLANIDPTAVLDFRVRNDGITVVTVAGQKLVVQR